MVIKSWFDREHIVVGKKDNFKGSEYDEESEPESPIDNQELEVFLELEEKYRLFSRCGEAGKRAVEKRFREYNEGVDRKILDTDLIFLAYLDEFNEGMRRYSVWSL